MGNKTIRIGTRGSQLALYQAYKVRDAIKENYPGLPVEVKIIKTRGDTILDVALSKIGDKGLFTKELEIELLKNTIDIAVHSLKDLPTILPDGCTLGGALERGEFRDALVHIHGKKFHELDNSDVIATSSLRRKAQLLRQTPEFKIVDIRGNVNTRLQKMNDGHCTAMIMAAAGLQRLGFEHLITQVLHPDLFIPAVGQGAIAMEIRVNDTNTYEILQSITHKPTLIAVLAERTFLRLLEGGCQVPIGCYTKIDNTKFAIKGFVSNLDATVMIMDEMKGDVNDSLNIAKKLAESLLASGAAPILKKIRDDNKV